MANLLQTEVRFEEDEIASIVTGLQKDDISLQSTPNILYIEPLKDKVSGDISVVLRNGESRILQLVEVEPSDRDISIRILRDVSQITSRVRKIAQEGLTPAGLIKAMALGQDINGVAISPANQVILARPMLVAHKLYDAVYMKGYIVDMENKDFDIRTIALRGLIAAAVYQGKGYFVIENNIDW